MNRRIAPGWIRLGVALALLRFLAVEAAESPAEAAGMKLVQKGDYRGGRYAYLDGRQRYGAVVELLEND